MTFLTQIAVEKVFSFEVMETELRRLVRMIVVPSSRRLPKPKDTHSVADPHCEHHCLHSRRIMELLPVVEFPPFFRRLTGVIHEPLQRVVLYYSGAEEIESRVGDDQGRSVGGVA